MNVLFYLLILTFFFCCGSASADNWRDDNPNQPNGYAASMYRYHHGTPDDDGPHDGYRATEIRARNGLDRFAPPDKDDDGGSRWGGGDNGSGGGGRWGGSGSGLGRHFRQGQAEGEAYWSQRIRNQMQASGGGLQSAGYVHGMQNPQYGNAPPYPMNGMGGMNGMGQMGGFQNNQMYQNQQAQQFQRFNVNNQLCATSGNCQYAPSNGGFNSNYSSTALQHAVSQRPIGTLLRNSRGGFNRIYQPQQ